MQLGLFRGGLEYDDDDYSALCLRPRKPRGGIWGRKDDTVAKLDRKDALILNALQQDARLTGEDLGPRIHLSAAACNRRIKRLRDAKVIEGEVAIVSPTEVGLGLFLTVLISLKSDHAPDAVEQLKAAFRARPEIVNAVSVAGQWDFVLTVAARGPERYEQMMRELRVKHPDLDGAEALLVLDRVKVGLAIQIEVTGS